MPALDTPFWRNVESFRAMGLDPLRWVAGCSVKVDDELVLYPALAAARGAFEEMGVTVAPRGGPALVERRGDPLVVRRLIVDPSQAAVARPTRRGNPLWASVLGRVDRPMGDDPRALAEGLASSVADLPEAARRTGLAGEFDHPLVVGSLEAHATAQPGAQFFAFDFLESGRGPSDGRFAVKGDALEVTDATLDPYDPAHARGALAAAMAPLLAIGCAEQLRAWPLLDAPTEQGRRSLERSFAEACRASGVFVEPADGPKRGALFIGATVAGRIDHDPPGRHQDVAPGMEVAITRPFGDLAPLLVRLMARSEADLEQRAERAGFPMAELDRQAEVSRAALTQPDLIAARAIAAHRPAAGEAFESANHIAATVDLSLEGAVGLVRFAKRRALDLRIDALPLAHEGLSRFATSEFLTDNATANAPGAVAVVAYPSALAQVAGRLEEDGRHLVRVATVMDIARGQVAAPERLRTAVGAKRLLEGVAFS